MRAILVIAIAATFVLTAWWSHTSFADARLSGKTSIPSASKQTIDPNALLSTMPPLPIQYAAPI